MARLSEVIMPDFHKIHDELSAWIAKDVFPLSVLAGLRSEWPDNSWDYWILYNDSTALKKASRCSLEGLPSLAKAVVTDLALSPLPEPYKGCDWFPDMSLHGSGVHEILPGGYLMPHLDCARHPIKPWTRRLSMCYYLDTLPEGEGELTLYGESFEVKVPTVANTLVVFDAANLKHGVSTTGSNRRSISLFYWSEGIDLGRSDTSAKFGV